MYPARPCGLRTFSTNAGLLAVPEKKTLAAGARAPWKAGSLGKEQSPTLEKTKPVGAGPSAAAGEPVTKELRAMAGELEAETHRQAFQVESLPAAIPCPFL